GPDFCLLSGDDVATLPMMAIGAHGVISVLANLIPVRFRTMVDLAAAGNFREASEIQYQTLTLIQSLFLEVNPIPVKAALAMMGKIENELRLPLTPLSAAPAAVLFQELKAHGLVTGARA